MSNPVTKPLRIGEILVQQGVLSEQQVFEIVDAQRRRHQPFGLLAEEMFDVTVDSIEQAWIEQYYQFTGPLDLASQRIDARALAVLNRRQAWQFEMLPLHFESTGELLIAASRTRLARAVAFAAQRIDAVAFFRIAESEELRTFLQQHYPMPEISESLLAQARRMSWPSRDEHAA